MGDCLPASVVAFGQASTCCAESFFSSLAFSRSQALAFSGSQELSPLWLTTLSLSTLSFSPIALAQPKWQQK